MNQRLCDAVDPPDAVQAKRLQRMQAVLGEAAAKWRRKDEYELEKDVGAVGPRGLFGEPLELTKLIFSYLPSNNHAAEWSQFINGVCHSSVHDNPLHYAARSGQTGVVQALLDAGAKVNVKGSFGGTPLCMAVLQGPADMVQALLAAGAKVNVPNKYGATPLHLAVGDCQPSSRSSSTDVVQALLRAKADVNAKDSEGRTPLHKRWSQGRRSNRTPLQQDVVKLLLDAGAKVNGGEGQGEG